VSQSPSKVSSLHLLCLRLFVCGATAPSGPGPPHTWGFYITHNDAPQSVGLLWTSDQLVEETSTWQHTQHSQQTNVHALDGIRTHNLSRRTATDLRLRPHDHWDQRYYVYWWYKKDLIQNTLSSSVWLRQVGRHTIHVLTDICEKTGVSWK